MASAQRSVVVSALFTLFGGPGLVLVYLPWTFTRFRIPANEPAWQRILAGGLIAVGLIPLLESIVRFVRVGRGTLMPLVPTEELVISGLYRYVRNPMYVGVVLVAASQALLFRSWCLAAYAAIVWAVMHAFVCIYEEPTLRRRYGAAYGDYCLRVRRWWPAWRAL
jgi:protein-S-isoprenylcysteine O-methyltransferase Ste14